MKRSKTLTEIADQTRISRRYLEAIEADNLSDLPGEFFYKAFLRQYANALDLDAETTKQIVGAAASIPDPDPVPAMVQVYERAQTGTSTRWHPSTGVAIGVLVAVLAGGSALYAWWQRSYAAAEPGEPVAEAKAPESAPAAQKAAEGAPAPAATTGADAAPVSPQQPVATAPVGTAATTPASAAAPPAAAPVPSAEAGPVVPGPGQVMVQVTAVESAWMEIRSEGRVIYTGTMAVNQTRSFAVGPEGRLFTGNAGALQVQVNGRPLGPLGPTGQVRTVLFSGGEPQIVAPKPKVKPEDAQLFSTPPQQ